MDMNTYEDTLKCISRHEIIEYCLIQVFIFSRGDPWVTQGDCCNFKGGGGGPFSFGACYPGYQVQDYFPEMGGWVIFTAKTDSFGK